MKNKLVSSILILTFVLAQVEPCAPISVAKSRTVPLSSGTGAWISGLFPTETGGDTALRPGVVTENTRILFGESRAKCIDKSVGEGRWGDEVIHSCRGHLSVPYSNVLRPKAREERRTGLSSDLKTSPTTPHDKADRVPQSGSPPKDNLSLQGILRPVAVKERKIKDEDKRIQDAQNYIDKAAMYTRSRNYAQAAKYYKKAAGIYEELGMKKIAAELWVKVAREHFTLKQYVQTAKCHEKAAALFAESNKLKYAAENWFQAGKNYRNVGLLNKALLCAIQSLNLYTQVGDKRIIVVQLAILAKIHFELNQFAESSDYRKRHALLSEELGEFNFAAKSWALAAQCHSILKDFKSAGFCDRRAAKIAEQLKEWKYSAKHYRYATDNFEKAIQKLSKQGRHKVVAKLEKLKRRCRQKMDKMNKIAYGAFGTFTKPNRDLSLQSILRPRAFKEKVDASTLREKRLEIRERYIAGFANIKDTTDSTNHVYVYQWVKEKVSSGGWPSDCVLLNFDYHKDYFLNEEANNGNWARLLRRENKIGRYWWVTSNPSEYERAVTEEGFEKYRLDSLPDAEKAVIITIDLDYFLFSPTPSRPITYKSVEEEIRNLAAALKSKRYHIIGVNITHSPSFNSRNEEFKNFVVERLGQELSAIFGDVALDERIRVIRYGENDCVQFDYKNKKPLESLESTYDGLIKALDEDDPAILIAVLATFKKTGGRSDIDRIKKFIERESSKAAANQDVLTAAKRALVSLRDRYHGSPQRDRGRLSIDKRSPTSMLDALPEGANLQVIGEAI